MLPDFDDQDNMVEDDVVQEVNFNGKKVGRNTKGGAGSSKLSKSNKPRQRGPMDNFVTLKPERVIKLRKQEKLKQTNLDDAYDKHKREMACQYIGRFFYQALITFNCAWLDSFKWMVEAIGQYGPNMKPPSYHEWRVPILKKEIGVLTFELFDKFVEQIGEANVVQVISDNGSNYILAGKLLEVKRPHLYWTPFVAHCIDHMLEDIGKIPLVKKTIERGIALTITLMGPLVRVLWLVDSEKKPATGYIHEAMDRGKEAIRKSFNGNEKYKEVFKIIDERWDCQLHRPLHAAGHFLNPEFFYDNPSMEFDEEVTRGLYSCMARLVPNVSVQDKIIDELSMYKRAEGSVIDPLLLDDIDEINGWLIRKMGVDQPQDVEDDLVFDGLTWGEVASASGVEEARKYTRYQARSREASSSRLDFEEEEVDSEETEEEIEGCQSNDDESDGDFHDDYIVV
ncbi:hypothetical protein F0562_025643 [Nyssa sinensis]|uniref:DUF659 domain-containing protein n=1 Tax=Nyssa sinensis TaxID=561372 RepID=A0A5J5BCL2_9ASTE|nr:hypothetical protein F0562_025643 [Nyssa sinensis]